MLSPVRSTTLKGPSRFGFSVRNCAGGVVLTYAKSPGRYTTWRELLCIRDSRWAWVTCCRVALAVARLRAYRARYCLGSRWDCPYSDASGDVACSSTDTGSSGSRPIASWNGVNPVAECTESLYANSIAPTAVSQLRASSMVATWARSSPEMV